MDKQIRKVNIELENLKIDSIVIPDMPIMAHFRFKGLEGFFNESWTANLTRYEIDILIKYLEELKKPHQYRLEHD